MEFLGTFEIMLCIVQVIGLKCKIPVSMGEKILTPREDFDTTAHGLIIPFLCNSDR